jgi:hypothetical protein
VRYLDTQNNICEDFLQYIKVDSLTGISLSLAIINGLYIILKIKKIDLVEAVCLAEAIISALKNIRINIKQEFNNIFLMAEVIKVN